jgi:hypothetical protein
VTQAKLLSVAHSLYLLLLLLLLLPKVILTETAGRHRLGQHCTGEDWVQQRNRRGHNNVLDGTGQAHQLLLNPAAHRQKQTQVINARKEAHYNECNQQSLLRPGYATEASSCSLQNQRVAKKHCIGLISRNTKV